MKTTFSYFPGMFENPAPAKYYLKKKQNQKYYEILNRYECFEKLSMTIGFNIWIIVCHFSIEASQQKSLAHVLLK